MSVSYWSYGIIGCEVDKSELYKTTKIRACDCAVDRIEDDKFCSKCGEEVWEEESTPIEGYDEDSKLFGYDLIHNTDYQRCWVTIRGAKVDDDSNAIKLDVSDDISDLREELKAVLEPHGLWDEEKFGIWAIQYCSY